MVFSCIPPDIYLDKIKIENAGNTQYNSAILMEIEHSDAQE